MSALSNAMAGGAAVQAGSQDYLYNDDETNAVDTIANILHWVRSAGLSRKVEDILDSAKGHYYEETRSARVDERFTGVELAAIYEHDAEDS